jgi:hypothetical protein
MLLNAVPLKLATKRHLSSIVGDGSELRHTHGVSLKGTKNTEKNNSGPLLKNFQEADSSEFVKEISGICIP